MHANNSKSPLFHLQGPRNISIHLIWIYLLSSRYYSYICYFIIDKVTDKGCREKRNNRRETCRYRKHPSQTLAGRKFISNSDNVYLKGANVKLVPANHLLDITCDQTCLVIICLFISDTINRIVAFSEMGTYIGNSKYANAFTFGHDFLFAGITAVTLSLKWLFLMQYIFPIYWLYSPWRYGS